MFFASALFEKTTEKHLLEALEAARERVFLSRPCAGLLSLLGQALAVILCVQEARAPPHGASGFEESGLTTWKMLGKRVSGDGQCASNGIVNIHTLFIVCFIYQLVSSRWSIEFSSH